MLVCLQHFVRLVFRKVNLPCESIFGQVLAESTVHFIFCSFIWKGSFKFRHYVSLINLIIDN